ncbi:MAG: YHS domain-containing protein [Phycisphaerae bacterium]|jgi:YHS domain-containing protein
MKSIGLSTLASVLGLFLAAGCCEQCKEPERASDQPAEKSASAGESKAMTVAQKNCPVGGHAIDPAVYTEYEGKKVYFCCPKCIDKFKSDPAKYMAKLE